jgi:cellulose biosynthesis protein BcsQ
MRSWNSFLTWLRRFHFSWLVFLPVVAFLFFSLGLHSLLLEMLAEWSPAWRGFFLLIVLSLAVAAGFAELWKTVEAKNLEGTIQALQTDLDNLEQELERRMELSEEIWEQSPLFAEANQFLATDRRAVRFVTVINFKGGVGKTTLAANLGVTFALMDRPLKVLAVDLDWQGTLSNICLEVGILKDYRENRKDSSARLLRDYKTLTAKDVRRIAAPMNKVPNGWVIAADNALEQENMQAQARFFLSYDRNNPALAAQAREVRFLFHRFFHDASFSGMYDLILFDCPPRLNPSVLNALTCSDFVVVPTKLDEKSVEAVPRTLTFLNRLGKITQIQHTMVVETDVRLSATGNLSGMEKDIHVALRDQVARFPGVELLRTRVKYDGKIKHDKAGTVDHAAPAIYPAVRKLFLPVAEELRKRWGL